MRVEGNFNVWEMIVGERQTQVRLSESRKNNQTGQYETINSFRATVRGEALEFLNSIKDQIPAAGEHGKKAPWVHFEGALERRGTKKADGTYNNDGYITFFRANMAGSNASAPSQAAAPAAANEGGFLEVPEGIDEELPFA